MVPADGDGADAGLPQWFIEIGDLLDAVFVVIGAGEGDIAEVGDARALPLVDAELEVHAALYAGDIAHRAGDQMLVTLRRAVPGGVGNAHKADILPIWRLMGRAKERRDPPPIQVLHH